MSPFAAALRRYAALVPRSVRRLLLLLLAAYILFVTVCGVWLSYSPTAEHLHLSIGKYAELTSGHGMNVFRGTLVAADIVPDNGRLRFLVRLMELGPDGRTARSTQGMTLDVWQLGNVKVLND